MHFSILSVANLPAERNISPFLAVSRCSRAKISEKSKQEFGQRGIIFEKKVENIINRAKGQAEHPRSMERVPVDTEFDIEIVLQVYDIDDEAKLTATVKSGLEWIEQTYLGKGGSRGSGKVSFKNLTLDGQPFRLD